MNTAVATITETAPDFDAIKAKQQSAWASGDYAIIGTTLQIVGEQLCEAIDVRAGARVLDVAAGNGNATLAAARRWCDVTSTDYVPSLLERAQERAAAERLAVQFRQADVEALPFSDDHFDAVLSTFGVMFAPNHLKSASEMVRVVRQGGKVGLANWTPTSFIGQLFGVIGKHVAPPAGVKSPALWGTREYLEELFGEAASSIHVTSRTFNFRYLSVMHWLELFRTYYGPVHKAFESLGGDASKALGAELIRLAQQHNVAHDGTMVVPAEYVEVVVTKR